MTTVNDKLTCFQVSQDQSVGLYTPVLATSNSFWFKISPRSNYYGGLVIIDVFFSGQANPRDPIDMILSPFIPGSRKQNLYYRRIWKRFKKG